MEGINGRLRDELLDRELFLSLPEARVVLDQWWMDRATSPDVRRGHPGLGSLHVRCAFGPGWPSARLSWKIRRRGVLEWSFGVSDATTFREGNARERCGCDR
jgi:hypothetical protein